MSQLRTRFLAAALLGAGLLAGCARPQPAVETTPAPTASAAGAATPFAAEVDAYLRDYATTFQRLYYASQEAQWASNTHIVAGDTTNAARTKAAQEAYARFVGSNENVARIRRYLARRAGSPAPGASARRMLYAAGKPADGRRRRAPQRSPPRAAQTEKLYGYSSS